MDPNETLEDIRRCVRVLDGHRDLAVRALVVLVDELDGWLTAGNAAPTQWAIGRAMAERQRRG